jgi:hypothetical protein
VITIHDFEKCLQRIFIGRTGAARDVIKILFERHRVGLIMWILEKHTHTNSIAYKFLIAFRTDAPAAMLPDASRRTSITFGAFLNTQNRASPKSGSTSTRKCCTKAFLGILPLPFFNFSNVCRQLSRRKTHDHQEAEWHSEQRGPTRYGLVSKTSPVAYLHHTREFLVCERPLVLGILAL